MSDLWNVAFQREIEARVAPIARSRGRTAPQQIRYIIERWLATEAIKPRDQAVSQVSADATRS